jgi:hypothetical protein
MLFHLGLPWWRGKGAPLPSCIKEAQRERRTQLEPCALLPLPWCVGPLHISLYPLSCGSPKGCIGAESTPPLHIVVLRNFWIRSEPTYFCNLGWIGNSGVIIDHRTCVTTRRCCPLWHRSHCTEFFATLRSATLATSSVLVRERNPAFGLLCHQSSNHYSDTFNTVSGCRIAVLFP